MTKKRLTAGPGNAKYTHHSVQDALLKVMVDIVLGEIRDEVQKASFFSVICNETKDLSKKKQLSVVLRYFLGGEIHEEFVGFNFAESINAEAIAQYITELLSKIGVDIKLCMAQSYDGASVMSGHVSGVQKSIKDYSEWALYVHCYAHRLNLIVVDCCKSVKHVADFFSLLQRLYNFVSGSYINSHWLSLQKELRPHEKPMELKSLSDTRWKSQVAACRVVKERLDVIVRLLDIMQEDCNRDRALEAQSILKLMDVKFVFCLIITYDFLKQMKGASDSLQSVAVDAGVARDLIANCVDFFYTKTN